MWLQDNICIVLECPFDFKVRKYVDVLKRFIYPSGADLLITSPGGLTVKPDDLFLLYEKRVAEFKLELIRKLSGENIPAEKPRLKSTSNIDMVEAVLKNAGKPLHVHDIIATVKEKFGIELDRDSMSSAIIKQVRKEKRFVRVAPNTFGLRQS
jgi:hypothetical protein